MKHKCFVSFKTEDIFYKNQIQNMEDVEIIDKSLNEPINSSNEDYIMRKIREQHLKDSTVTICLIGSHSAEYDISENQNYIKREIQGSLYDLPNGILGIVLPEMYDKIFKGKSNHKCDICGYTHNITLIDNTTTIREFNYNYYLPNPSTGCSWFEDDRYCCLTKWKNFIKSPNFFINEAFEKRTSSIKNKIKVFPK